MKKVFTTLAKTKKGKIQLLTMGLSTLLAIVFTIILIVFGVKDCKYNSPYTFEMNFGNYSITEEITLKEDGTCQLFVVVGEESDVATSQYYISDGNLFTKEVDSSNYQLAGKISYYELNITSEGATITLKCRDAIVAKNICLTFLIISLVAIAAMIAWIFIEKYLKNKKTSAQTTETTILDNNLEENAENKVQLEQVDTKEESVNSDTNPHV